MRVEKYFEKLKENEPKIKNIKDIYSNVIIRCKYETTLALADNYVSLTIIGIYVLLYIYSSISGLFSIDFGFYSQSLLYKKISLNLLSMIIPASIIISIPISLIVFKLESFQNNSSYGRKL